MGIVLKQSFTNTISLFLGFAIGAVNVLFLYTHFLSEDYYALITFLLSASMILQPLISLGVQHTIIKFYSSYPSSKEKNQFLISGLFAPLLTIIPLTIIGIISYESIAGWLSQKNKMIEDYVWLIFVLAIFMGYFELFYAWSQVQLKSVFGHFIREVFARLCIFFLLFAVHFKWLNSNDFIYAVVIVYGIRTLLIKAYAFYLCKPRFVLGLPKNSKEIISFSTMMIIAGSASGILLEIDKSMIPQMRELSQVAYYTVAVYIANVIAIPNRALQQIATPLTAQKMNEKKQDEVLKIYRDSSFNLLIVGGWLFLLINLNINELYDLVNKPNYLQGIGVVLIISLAKMIEHSQGTANAILLNSSVYKNYFIITILMAVGAFFFNLWLIPIWGIQGAGIATLLVVLVSVIVKIIYIYYRWKMFPFTPKTLQLLGAIVLLFGAFYFWQTSFPPLISIFIKSILISILYLLFINKIGGSFISEQLLKLLKNDH